MTPTWGKKKQTLALAEVGQPQSFTQCEIGIYPSCINFMLKN